jgi:mono/diheme cytochrome c family protein
MSASRPETGAAAAADPMRTARRFLWLAVGLMGLMLVVALVLVVRELSAPALPPVAAPAPPASPQLVERGAYLARAGNCAACHTTKGEAAYAGGPAIEIPFGRVYPGNLTPDPEHGLGRWSADAFWRAMYHGRSRDGRLLNPVFPYPSYTHITREDSDAIFAFLQSQTPVARPNTPHALRFPVHTQAALAAWRVLYFQPTTPLPEPGAAVAAARTAEWNRGAYLVHGLGHCATCHATRDVLGGVHSGAEFTGGHMSEQGWYAPSLHDRREAGVGHWTEADVVRLLQTGVARGAPQGASTMGPMAEVVFHGTQHLSAADLSAMAVYLQSLDTGETPSPTPVPPPVTATAPESALGQRVYETHCIDCHGAAGEGARNAYPALAGNRAVTMASSANPVQAILSGGFPPSTAGHPQPYGMPPFRTLLTDAEIAAVATYIRQSWGNQAGVVMPLEVSRLR